MKKALTDVLIGVALAIVILAVIGIVAGKINSTSIAPASSPPLMAVYRYTVEVDGIVYECQDIEFTADEESIFLYRCRNYTKTILLTDYTELAILISRDDE